MEPDIQKYKGKSGVWAIRGKIEQDSGIKYEYLNVASAADMGSEIEEDLSLMSDGFQNELQNKSYISKWNESLVDYVDYKHNPRRVAVWKAISEYINQNCKGCFDIVLIAEETDEGKRHEIEQDFAFYTKAKFWSDRRHYEIPTVEVEEHRKEYINTNNLEEKFKSKEFEIIYTNAKIFRNKQR